MKADSFPDPADHGGHRQQQTKTHTQTHLEAGLLSPCTATQQQHLQPTASPRPHLPAASSEDRSLGVHLQNLSFQLSLPAAQPEQPLTKGHAAAATSAAAASGIPNNGLEDQAWEPDPSAAVTSSLAAATGTAAEAAVKGTKQSSLSQASSSEKTPSCPPHLSSVFAAEDSRLAQLDRQTEPPLDGLAAQQPQASEAQKAQG